MNAPKPQPPKSTLIEDMKEAVANPKPKAPKHKNYTPKNRPLKDHEGLRALKAELENK